MTVSFHFIYSNNPLLLDMQVILFFKRPCNYVIINILDYLLWTNFCMDWVKSITLLGYKRYCQNALRGHCPSLHTHQETVF